MTLNVQAVVVIVIIKIIIFTKNYYYVLCRENQERGTFIFCGLYFPNLTGSFTSHSTAAEAANGTNCTFTKFLYASLTRDSSALSPFLCMKTPWHSAKIPRHHFSTQLAMAIPLYHFFFQCHLARRLLNFAGMLPNSCFCYGVKVDRDICQVKTSSIELICRLTFFYDYSQ